MSKLLKAGYIVDYVGDCYGGYELKGYYRFRA